MKATIFHSCLLHPSFSSTLVAYFDSNCSKILNDHSSRSTCTIYFGGNPIFWSFKKQYSVTCSSTVIEFGAIATTVSEICWLHNLFYELGTIFSKPIFLYDSLGAIFLCTNLMYHSKMKHAEIDFYFICDKIAQRVALGVSHSFRITAC